MAPFSIFPAIDLRHGQVVRLIEGDPTKQTSYSKDPEQMAQKWIDAGAKWLHVINLDGAFGEETGENQTALSRIARVASKNNTAIQFGGGIRNIDTLKKAMDIGVSRAILGTAALENESLVEIAVKEYGESQIAVSLDARDGIVQVHGWKTDSKLDIMQMASDMANLGIRWIIYTDISRDGLQTGINIEATKSLSLKSGLNIIASGGVSDWNDIISAYEAELPGIIVGRALYENQFIPEELFAFPGNYNEKRKR